MAPGVRLVAYVVMYDGDGSLVYFCASCLLYVSACMGPMTAFITSHQCHMSALIGAWRLFIALHNLRVSFSAVTGLASDRDFGVNCSNAAVVEEML